MFFFFSFLNLEGSQQFHAFIKQISVLDELNIKQSFTFRYSYFISLFIVLHSRLHSFFHLKRILPHRSFPLLSFFLFYVKDLMEFSFFYSSLMFTFVSIHYSASPTKEDENVESLLR